ncbi:hypothetical protein H0H93_010717 [Arthromyces matolae]|nr:hypothetical protein H0H93_010717 [Arthromyces matolae]
MPLFIDSTVTWRNLHSLTWKTTHPRSVDPKTLSVWSEMSNRNFSIYLPSLKTLSVRAQPEIFSIVLRLAFPWNQLTSFTVSLSGQTPDVPILLETLRQCESLKYLGIKSKEPPITASFFEDDPVILPALQNLQIRRAVPPLITKLLVSSGTLRSLDLDFLNLFEFHGIVRQCSNLRYLECSIVSSQETKLERFSLPTIILPHLTELRLYLEPGTAWPPLPHCTLLTTPNLSALEIFVDDQFPLEQTTDLIARSDRKLSDIELYSRIRHSVPDEQLFAILSLLNSCSRVEFMGFVFSEPILNLIASRSLLPMINTFSFGASSSKAVSTALENRMKNKTDSGYVRLCDVKIHLDTALSKAEEEEFIESLGAIEKKYDLNITYITL